MGCVTCVANKNKNCDNNETKIKKFLSKNSERLFWYVLL